jgi:hypothetical protein
MQAARDKAPGPAKSGEYIKEKLKWQSELPAESEAGNFWEKKVYKDGMRVAMIKNGQSFSFVYYHINMFISCISWLYMIGQSFPMVCRR